MNWIEIGREESRQKYEDYCATGNLGFSKDYDELRKDLVDLFSTALIKVGITEDQISQKNYSYQLDLQFGLKLYTTLNEKYGMNVRLAATDGVWRYLCSYVAPDLVEKRYGKDHPDRIWKKPKRLWLRVLWWYISPGKEQKRPQKRFFVITAQMKFFSLLTDVGVVDTALVSTGN